MIEFYFLFISLSHTCFFASFYFYEKKTNKKKRKNRSRYNYGPVLLRTFCERGFKSRFEHVLCMDVMHYVEAKNERWRDLSRQKEPMKKNNKRIKNILSKHMMVRNSLRKKKKRIKLKRNDTNTHYILSRPCSFLMHVFENVLYCVLMCPAIFSLSYK